MSVGLAGGELREDSQNYEVDDSWIDWICQPCAVRSSTSRRNKARVRNAVPVAVPDVFL